jgi:hypothetical protein
VPKTFLPHQTELVCLLDPEGAAHARPVDCSALAPQLLLCCHLSAGGGRGALSPV